MRKDIAQERIMTSLQKIIAKHKRESPHFIAKKKRKNKKSTEDAKWGTEVKVRAGGVCEVDDCENRRPYHNVAPHHVFTRKNESVRHYPPNGVCLCNGHHRFFAHMKPHEFKEWIIGKRGVAWWNDLREKSNTRHVKFTIADETVEKQPKINMEATSDEY